MSANQQKKSLAQAKARAKAKKRKLQREHEWPRSEPAYRDVEPVVYAVNDSTNDVKFLGPAPGVEKMSAVLLEFIEPFQSATPTDDEVFYLARLGALAWNVALFPDELRPKEIDRIVRHLTVAEVDLFYKMIDRKLIRFRDNHRSIVKVDMGERPEGCTLLVSSTFESWDDALEHLSS